MWKFIIFYFVNKIPHQNMNILLTNNKNRKYIPKDIPKHIKITIKIEQDF